ncbi:MAG: 2-C-methyl-D-erythritol 2,4-cyclodiphosphate synthase [Oscillospiraceae bacterium]|nr:2-C-methyl-D-erythritol 2,4-cyclodiphosphate synthase [Oscillospiraceae bacterium]MBR1842226.1 2-C-methyl-D-erythritol 2,4-cyclodiphosphate synthase [Oscillospiraceae bacterium]
MRIGHGYDVHRFMENRKLVICGVEIPYKFGLLGHSDADVATHALMDALMGAAAMGDIGGMFPDSDPAYAGINSLILLDKVMERITASGFTVSNADVTIIAERPKMHEYIPQMVKNLAEKLRIDESRVNVKATTEEGLGFTGALEGIAAHAVVLLNE